MKGATVALIVRYQDGAPELLETISDDREILVFQAALETREVEPLHAVHVHRAGQSTEEDEFGDYIEDLISQPFVRREIQDHGVKWLRSKIKIEKFQKQEADAAKVISDYAYQVFRDNPDRTDFFLAGPTTQVRILVFVLDQAVERNPVQKRSLSG